MTQVLLYLIHVIGISCNKDNECVIMMIILACLYRMESKRRAAWRGCPAVWCTCLSWWLFITWVKGQMWADNSWPLGTGCQWLCSCISLPQRQHSALRLSHDFFFNFYYYKSDKVSNPCSQGSWNKVEKVSWPVW